MPNPDEVPRCADSQTRVLTGDGSNTVLSATYGETYHSRHGAVTESQQVYLHAAGVSERLQHSHPVAVLEIGLGLGLNFLLSADLAIQNGTRLDYHAFEIAMPSVSTIRAMRYDRFVAHKELYSAYLEALRQFSADSEQFVVLHPLVSLRVATRDVSQSPIPMGSVDAIYLDAFSPDNNPECWESEFLARLALALVPGGRLSTYCSKGRVRRALEASGLRVKKLPGPPGKREILVGERI